MRTRRLAIGSLVAAVVAVAAVVVLGSGSDARRLHVTFASAVNLVEGAEVRQAGVRVGTVEEIEARDGRAEVTLAIDEDAWPLREGTTAAIRWGSTVGYALRYVELTPGPRDAEPLADGARIAREDTLDPVDFDRLYAIFDRPTRRDLARLVDHGEATFGDRGDELRRAAESGAETFDQLADTMHELADDPSALRRLVRTAGGTARALAERRADLSALVSGAAGTFEELARRADELRATLRRLPGTLQAVRGTLGRLDTSRRRLDALVGDLAPGAAAARTVTGPLRRIAGTLTRVAPDLEATLADLDDEGPQITKLLDDARPLLVRLEPVLGRANPMVSCLRPYTPEIVAFFTTWHAFSTGYDAYSHHARANVQRFNYGNTATDPPAAQQAFDPNLDYAFIRPPGYNAGQPHFIPECGAGPEGLDARKDPEAR